ATALAETAPSLAAITSAELRLSPLPRSKCLGVLFFASVIDAMEATMDILDLKPAAIEHVDRVLFDQTRGQLAFARARALLRLDEESCEAFLIVEFYDDTEGRLETLMGRNLGIRRASFTGPEEMEHIWRLRKAGLSLLTGRKGDAKPTAGIEDVAVTPQRLPEYVRGMQGLLDARGLEASFYGHAAAGLLHIRPVVDLHKREDLETYRALADEVSALTRQLRASIAGEHGVGIARTEYLPEHLGPELMAVTESIKALFDPKNLMNPGKIVGDGRYAIDTNLRQGAGNLIELPFEPVLAFAAKDESFIGNLEQCNGCGGCRKDAPTMCPTFIATGEEIMSTRGRANTIRAVLEYRLDAGASPLRSDELEMALKYCLSCKACTTECPSNVNMALLKAELIHARHREHGLPLRERVLSRVDLLGALGASMPRLANTILGLGPVRVLMETTLGLSAKRSLPGYTTQRFDRWFARRDRAGTGSRGKVMLWDDCFVRYNEPEIGKAAVAVLEAAGYEVVLPSGRACCGRPAFSTGRLDLAAEFGRANLEQLHAGDDLPVVFLEPSCYAMFAEDYRELGLAHATEIEKRAFLFETFIGDLLEREPDALRFEETDRNVAVHVHCHAKSLIDAERSVAPARRIPGAEVTLLQTGCCGMAGAFGALRDTYELSCQVAAPLVEQVQALPEGTHLIASGTSCRHQIRDLAGVEAQHMAQVLAAALRTS
ncbi:MAG: 4Fe-4S dicluster domain-containing protein, partial [Candidatus Hydrogenedentes bacterium]|nr:4Fe-4S dicluster domain-containing protein [Candidatus Hydrogenedentota bacterium]